MSVLFPIHLPGVGVAAMTNHALDRYQQRVRPHLETYRALHEDARRLIEVCGEMRSEPPEWANCHFDTRSQEHERARHWLVCGDVAFVCEESVGAARWAVMTTVCRGGISDESRALRNKRAAGRRYRRSRKQTRNERAEGRARKSAAGDAAAARTLRESDPGD